MYVRRSKVGVFTLAMLVCGADMAIAQDYPNASREFSAGRDVV